MLDSEDTRIAQIEDADGLEQSEADSSDRIELRRAPEPTALLVPLRYSIRFRMALERRGVLFSQMNPRKTRQGMWSYDGNLNVLKDLEEKYGWESGTAIVSLAVTAFIERDDLLELLDEIVKTTAPTDPRERGGLCDPQEF